eukprot:m.367417 g.367417  ORF g.367417 m.367417 type:complete len:89 (-) comp28101_c0_seq4:44-310(-)
MTPSSTIGATIPLRAVHWHNGQFLFSLFETSVHTALALATVDLHGNSKFVINTLGGVPRTHLTGKIWYGDVLSGRRLISRCYDTRKVE